jgi:hypothetical protein
VGCEGLELHILHWPHMDSIDLDPQPIIGWGIELALLKLSAISESLSNEY